MCFIFSNKRKITYRASKLSCLIRMSICQSFLSSNNLIQSFTTFFPPGSTNSPIQGRLPRSQSLTYNNLTPPTGATPSPSPLSVAMPPARGAAPPTLLRSSHSVPVSCNQTLNEAGDQTPAQLASPVSLPTTPGVPGAEEGASSDCKVCWEKSINCVLYTCGHMCLCYDCAMTIRSEKGLCPICRQAIMDVIKIYRS